MLGFHLHHGLVDPDPAGFELDFGEAPTTIFQGVTLVHRRYTALQKNEGYVNLDALRNTAAQSKEHRVHSIRGHVNMTSAKFWGF